MYRHGYMQWRRPCANNGWNYECYPDCTAGSAGRGPSGYLGSRPAWADDYFVRQWEIADKEIIKIDGEIDGLKEDIREMNAKLEGTPLAKIEQQNMAHKRAMAQEKIDRKEAKIDFLVDEIERLERLSIESHKVDAQTEARLLNARAAIGSAYGPDHGLTRIIIDRQDREVIVLIARDSNLTLAQLEVAAGHNTTIRLEIGESAPLSCASRTVACGTTMGGLKIKREGIKRFGTLGYYAVHNNGDAGFVTAGHVAGYSGAIIVQPSSANPIGRVTEICGVGNEHGTECDAAFIKLNSNKRYSNAIFKSSATSSHYRVTGTVPDSNQVPGTFLKKSGVVTGVTYGKLLDPSGRAGDLENVLEYNRANVPNAGDSGAAVFRQLSSRSDSIQIYGVLVSDVETALRGYYQPIDYVARQLNLR